MDFDKLQKCGKNIKLSEQKKTEIINKCRETDKYERKFLTFAELSPRIKRTTVALCAFVLAMTIGIIYGQFASGNNPPVIKAENHEPADTTNNILITENAHSDLQIETKTEKITESNIATSESDIGCGELLPRKYRNNYYSVPASFSAIVGRDAYFEWEDKYLAENYPDDSNEMVMAAYVKAFNISKEDFDRANLEYAKFIEETYSHICLDPQDYADQEMQEIYNADIIYTFDNEIINEYYLGIDYPFLNEYQYVEALEAGTYETRTTQFITVEQMEAEIIAKYGEEEIVTTEATDEKSNITE